MNNKRFGGFRQSGFGSRERWMLIGASVSIVSAIVLIAVLVSGKDEADATQKVEPQQAPQSADLNLGMVSLLVPVDSVPEGTKLGTVQLTEFNWPRSDIPEGAVRREDDIQDLYARVDLPAKQPILRANLSTAPLSGGIGDLIPPGNRAVTIEVNATSGVEGWATSGAHVDVLVTYHDAADGKKKTQIAIEDAIVISYNGETKRTARGEIVPHPSSSATVTLSVQVDDAVKLYTAQAMGQIGLILRNNSDRRSVGEKIVSTDDFSKVVAPEPVPAPKPEIRGFARFMDKDGKVKELELHEHNWGSKN